MELVLDLRGIVDLGSAIAGRSLPEIMFILRNVRARAVLPKVPNDPRTLPTPGPFVEVRPFLLSSLTPPVLVRVACSITVVFRSSLLSPLGSTLDNVRHSVSNLARMESSLLSTDGDPCSSVSRYQDEFIVLCYLVEV